MLKLALNAATEKRSFKLGDCGPFL